MQCFRELHASGGFNVFDVRCDGHDGATRKGVSELKLVFCRRGLFEICSAAGESVAEVGRSVLLAPDLPYSSRHLLAGGDECTSIGIAPELVEELRGAIGSTARLHGSIALPIEVTLLSLWVHARASRTRRPHRPARPDLELDERLLLLAERVFELALGQTPYVPPHLVRTSNRDTAFAVQELLNRRFRERITLRDISSELRVSAYHLCRVFRANVGRTIHQHLTALRLAEVAKRLAGGAPSLTELASELGFASHSHLTAAFRRAAGVPPSVYRREVGPGGARRPDGGLPVSLP